MRHRKHTSKLNRTSEHRAALLRNLAIALVTHERIRTTEVKAKQLRPFVEKLVTKARENDLASRRLVFSYLNDKVSVFKLFSEIGPRIAGVPERQNGGYLRIVKDGPRMGDGALMAYIEFVDQPVQTELSQGPDKRKTIKQRMHERRKEMAKMRR